MDVEALIIHEKIIHIEIFLVMLEHFIFEFN